MPPSKTLLDPEASKALGKTNQPWLACGEIQEVVDNWISLERTAFQAMMRARGLAPSRITTLLEDLFYQWGQDPEAAINLLVYFTPNLDLSDFSTLKAPELITAILETLANADEPEPYR